MSMPGGQTVTDTNNGFIVGADAPEGTIAPPETVQTTAPPQQQQPAPQGQQRFYTDEDIERVRREEKDKLYDRISNTEQQLKQLQSERDAEARRLKEEAEQRAAELRAKEEEGMEVRDLLAKKEQEWDARFQQMNATYEQDRAVFEMERKLQALEQYRQMRIEQEAEYIMPELRDLVHGDSETAIDASVEEMKARTDSIFQQIAAANGQQRQQMRGAAPTAPPVGPMEQLSDQQQFSPDAIRNMNMDEYKKHREALLRGAGRAMGH
jgi:hypothetical protein